MTTLVQSALGGLFSASLPSPLIYTYDSTKVKFVSSELSIFGKTAYYGSNFFKGLFFTAALPFAAGLSLLNYLKNRSIEWIRPSEKKLEKVMTEKDVLEKLSQMKLGPSDSTFQSSGIGNGSNISRPGFEGRCNWAEAVKHPVITDAKGNKKTLISSTTKELSASYRNILENPKTFIKILQAMGCTAYRFSVERSVIEPQGPDSKGKHTFDGRAYDIYAAFCRELKNAGIEPWITIDHYTSPEWFAKTGGFHNEENINSFVIYALRLINYLSNEAGVTKFMTFNELNGTGFCTEFMQFNPPDSLRVKENGKDVDKPILGIRAAFTNEQNRMRAHCTIFKKVQDLISKKQISKEVEIGLTHQFLKFNPCNPYNLIERITCCVLTFISHNFIFNFLKDGRLQVPFLMNTYIDTNGQKPLDFLGVQGYGHSYLKVGLGTGEEPSGIYPLKKYKVPLLGYLTKYHTFEAGNTSPDKGGKVQNFGPAVKPEDFEHDLEEAETLGIKMAITENGCDANIGHTGENGARFDEKTQEEYYQKIFKIVAKFKLMGYFFWTLFRGQHEWNNGVGSPGKGILLGVVDVEKDETTGKLTGKCNFSPAGKYIQTTFLAARGIAEANAKSRAA